MKLTSAAANKMLKKLESEKDYYLQIEQDAGTYVAAADETPVVPEFDFDKNCDAIHEIDLKMLKIKHAINLSNATARIDVSGHTMSVDEILVCMAQLSRRQLIYDEMRKQQPKMRVNSMSTRNIKPEYRYINYDHSKAKQRYEETSDEVTRLQLALDKYNQTFEFEIEGL